MFSDKVTEAQACVAAGEKQLRTGLTRWKPNYDLAADQFTQAAQCFRIARDLQQSMKYSRKASENYKLNKSFFHAAKALETAILVGKDITPAEEINSIALEAASLYQQHGSGDSAAGVLAKAASILRDNNPKMACKLYQQAADTSISEGGAHNAIEYTSKASRLLVELMMLDAAMESVTLEIGYHLQAGNTGAAGRMVVVGVLIQLARGDFVAAEKVYKEWGTYCEQAEKNTLEMLLQGMDEGDGLMMRRALRAPFLRSMDVEYARLATTIPLPESARPEGAAAANEDDEDPYEIVDLPARNKPSGGDLC